MLSDSSGGTFEQTTASRTILAAYRSRGTFDPRPDASEIGAITVPGRPTDLTPKLQRKIVAMVRDGVSPEVAAVAAGLHRSTYYDWRARGRTEGSGPYSDFSDAVESAIAQCEARAARIVARAFPDSWQAAMTLMERRFPDRWGRRERIDIYEHEKVRQEAERIAARFGVSPDLVLQRAGVTLPTPN